MYTKSREGDAKREVETLIREYYTAYYRDQLRLPDWRRRIELRLSEQDQAHRFLALLETWIGQEISEGGSALVVGGGTGAEFTALSARGWDAYAVEPSRRAAAIGRRKAECLPVPASRFMRGYGEALPFANNSFKLVLCIAVLEHVKDVETCIREMVRVTRPLGRILIVTYDYRQFYEPHYKMVMPLFLPKWILRVYLQIRGRPPEFLDSLQFVNQNMLGNIFQQCPVTAFQILQPWPGSNEIGKRDRLIRWMARTFDVQQRQWWILQKRNTTQVAPITTGRQCSEMR